MLEVIFAMVVILVGMVGVGLLIPLAGRQAADSYQITQGLAAGESATEMLRTTRIVSPTVDLPWCYIDDTNGLEIEVRSLDELYKAIVISSAGPTSPNQLAAAIAQNSALGVGFCIDPLFWGAQARGPSPFPAPVLRSNFPFFTQTLDPVSLGNLPDPVPRLRRVSFRDPSFPRSTTLPSVRGTWMRQPSAVKLASLYGGDIVQSSVAKNKALGPIRAEYTGSGSLIASPSSSDATTWMMTLTPADSTPIVPTSLIVPDAAGDFSNVPFFRPKLFDVAIVVFAKRDPRELDSTIPLGAFPVGERLMNVQQISPDALNSGTFEITLNANVAVSPRIKQGDWLMMSRLSFRDLNPKNGIVPRQVHRWYRVLAVDRNEPFEIRAKVVGKPWDFTDGEMEDLKNNGTVLPAVFPPAATIHAVVMKDVIQVFERQVEIE